VVPIADIPPQPRRGAILWPCASAVVTACIVVGAHAVSADVLTGLQAARHRAMVEFVHEQQRTRGRFDLWTFARPNPAQGQMPYDEIYNNYLLHVIGKARSEFNREEWFYQALCGVVAAEVDAFSGEPRVSGEQAHVLGGIQRLASLGAEIGDPQWVAEITGDPVVYQGLKPTVLAYADSIVRATALNQALHNATTILALHDDAKAVIMEPLLVTQHGIGVLEAIGASTGDADLAAACRRLKGELVDGQVDYVARVKARATQGELAGIAAGAVAKVGAKAGVTYLLGALGYQWGAAASVGAYAGSVFATFVAGTEVGLWLTGENAAYEHARLAHFADYIKPGLVDRWEKLLAQLDPGSAGICADFDRTCRALLLVAAYVQLEAARIKEAYDRAPLGALAGAYARLSAEPQLPLMTYRRWSTGEPFAEWLRLPGMDRGQPPTPPAAYAFVRDGYLFVSSQGTPDPQQVTAIGGCHSPAWARSGQLLAFVRNTKVMMSTAVGDAPAAEVWMCKPDGADMRCVVSSSVEGVGAGIWAVAWTPDDAAIIVCDCQWATSGGAWRVELSGEISAGPVSCNGLSEVDRPGVAFAIEKHDYTRGYGAEEIFLVDSYLRPQAYATELTDLFPSLSPRLRWAAVTGLGGSSAVLIENPVFEGPGWLERNASGDATTGNVCRPAGLPRRARSVFESDGRICGVSWSWDDQYVGFTVLEEQDTEGSGPGDFWVVETETGKAWCALRNVSDVAWRPTTQ
jgi:hypothetical protein